MVTTGQIKTGAYYDSVTLMRVGQSLTKLKGVVDAAVVMGTAANRSILQNSGLLVAEFNRATDTDLLVAVKARDRKAADAAIAQLDTLLRQARPAPSAAGGGAVAVSSLAGAKERMPDANLAMISVAGRYAAAEARQALDLGMHVMLFSDNVTLEDEVELKKSALKKGLLVMGPDCGTAIINGVPLAFANVVPRGPIGIVAAAGTGLQEVSTIIANEGSGVSQAIGTGGRDVKKDVGGMMFIAALQALANDPATQVILLVSKPPEASVLARINQVVRKISKPVVAMFLGAAGDGPLTLEEAALTAVAFATGKSPSEVESRLAAEEAQINKLAATAAGRRHKGQRYLRGLFSGGTFCAEAQVLLDPVVSGLHSNVPLGRTQRLKDSLQSRENTIIDLGEDEFTVGRPHPMIDFSLRNRQIEQEAANPEVAVILLDVVLGFGAHPDPVSELAPVLRRACRQVAVVCSVTGTDGDPQHRGKVVAALKKTGALVMPTNAAACKLAGALVGHLANGR